LGTVYEKTTELNITHPWTIKKIEKLLKKINDTMEWFTEKIKEIAGQASHENPAVYVS
jgi:hypothetical protein